MIFTASDVGSLSSSLSRWEIAEYVSEGFVIIGCAGELVASFFTRIPKNVRERIETWSTIVLILALSVGLKCLIKTNELSGNVIGSLGDKAAEADGKAQRAMSDSSTALTQAGSAITIAGDAKTKADAAKVAAGNALDFALAATKEEEQLKKKLADRHISPAQQERIRHSLAKWDGMDIRLPITMVNGDDETWTYAKELLGTLCQIPGWSAELDSLDNNSGVSKLAVTVSEDAPTPDKLLAKDLVTALHDAGIEASGPQPPPVGGGFGGGKYSACGKLNPQHPTVEDPSHPFNVKVEIQISRRL